MRIQTVDYHTAGEPYRIVTGGIAPLRGATVLDKRQYAEQALDDVRQFLVNEPRGHADMYGCFVTEPDDDGAEFGMVFFHKDGFSTACGHGTIAGATWALETGIVEMQEPTTSFSVDVPSGRLAVEAECADGVVGIVRFVNVPAWVSGLDIGVSIGDGQVDLDVAYGGAFYATLPAASVGLTATATDLDELIATARTIKAAMREHAAVTHPVDDRLSGLYGVIFYDDDGSSDGGPDDSAVCQRNITVFADGEVDRSPCGSGTSARLAVLDRRGQLPRGDVLTHRGVTGALFSGRVLGESADGVSTEVAGRASVTGFHTFVLERDDELGLGFQLR